FLRQGFDLLAAAGIQIDHPATQVLVFVDRDPAEAPQRRLRHLERAGAAVDRMRRAGDQPDAVNREDIGGRERLDELQRRDAAELRRRYQRVARHPFAGLRIEAPEMDDASEARRLLADALYQAPHIIRIAGADAEVRLVRLPEVGAVRHQDDGVAALSQLG